VNSVADDNHNRQTSKTKQKPPNRSGWVPARVPPPPPPPPQFIGQWRGPVCICETEYTTAGDSCCVVVSPRQAVTLMLDVRTAVACHAGRIRVAETVPVPGCSDRPGPEVLAEAVPDVRSVRGRRSMYFTVQQAHTRAPSRAITHARTHAHTRSEACGSNSCISVASAVEVFLTSVLNSYMTTFIDGPVGLLCVYEYVHIRRCSGSLRSEMALRCYPETRKTFTEFCGHRRMLVVAFTQKSNQRIFKKVFL
jgi:hypothetical protein